MPEPVTIAALSIWGLSWVAGKAAEVTTSTIVGSASSDVFANTVRGVRDRIAGLHGLPANHDVAKAIRTAQLQALERILRDCRERRRRPEWLEPPRTQEFFERSLAFCADQVGRSRDVSVKLNLEVTEPLRRAIDGILAPPADEGPARDDAVDVATVAEVEGLEALRAAHDGLAHERAAAVANLAEDAVLAELTAALDGAVLPPDFEAHFRSGAGACPRYLDLFGAYVSEQLKSNERFRAIFTTGQLSHLAAQVSHLEALALETGALARRIEEQFRDFRFGDLVVRGRGPARLTLTRKPGRRKLTDTELRLLDPFTQSIPLIGRAPFLEELWRWLQSDAPIAVRGLVGPAGAGKTRLALELCDQAEAEGWDAGFVEGDELTRFSAQQNLSDWEWEKATLVVVDYAAALAPQLKSWLAPLANNPGGVRRPLRLLLLERHADAEGGWWQSVFGSGNWGADAVRRLLDPPTPVRLPSVTAPGDRRAIFDGMLERLGVPAADPPEADPLFERRLAQLSWGGEPLFLMMAALAARQMGLATALTLSRTDVADRLAKREVTRIRQLAPTEGGRAFLAHMAAYVTLCQGLTRDEALDAIEEEQRSLRRSGAGDPPEIAEWLQAALPGRDDAIAPVLPDMIGEAVMLQALGEGKKTTATDCIPRAAARFRPRVVASVARAAQDYAPERSAPLDWLDRLAAATEDDWLGLAEFVVQLPTATLVLREPATKVTARLAQALRTRVAAGERDLLPAFAISLNHLAIRLSELGRPEPALGAAEEAVQIYRDLAAADANAVRHGLAMALDTLANRLSEVGRRETALEAAEEAVQIYRDLAADDADAVRPGLARALDTLANRLSHVGRPEPALEAAEEAVQIYRDLAAADADAVRPGLARALDTLANHLSEIGRRETALEAAEEAVQIYRDLAAARPDAFRPNLANSLDTLANCLSELGRRETALEAAEEAVQIYRDLAAADADAVRPELARALHNLAIHLSDVGRPEPALEAAEEAVQIYRDFAAARPDGFRPNLANSLNTLAIYLSGLGRRETALADQHQ